MPEDEAGFQVFPEQFDCRLGSGHADLLVNEALFLKGDASPRLALRLLLMFPAGRLYARKGAAVPFAHHFVCSF